MNNPDNTKKYIFFSRYFLLWFIYLQDILFRVIIRNLESEKVAIVKNPVTIISVLRIPDKTSSNIFIFLHT
jgi:hypothetical protein